MTHIPSLPATELPHLALMFTKDAKNYHVWSYRQWLVRHFSLWDSELPYIESLLRDDVRNNSAWNHRWFVVFGRFNKGIAGQASNGKSVDTDANEVSQDILTRELDYAKSAILLAPQNQSPWNYLRGVLKNPRSGGLLPLKPFAEIFADLDREDEVRSSHALDFLVDVYAEEKETQRAGKALELLARRYDPIRKNYWNWRRSALGLREVQA